MNPEYRVNCPSSFEDAKINFYICNYSCSFTFTKDVFYKNKLITIKCIKNPYTIATDSNETIHLYNEKDFPNNLTSQHKIEIFNCFIN